MFYGMPVMFSNIVDSMQIIKCNMYPILYKLECK